jgi:aspartate/tyrosine/aromatic aminotransferase
MYSNPPRHGASIATRILADPELYAQWRTELKGMADRILTMRQQLFEALREGEGTRPDWQAGRQKEQCWAKEVIDWKRRAPNASKRQQAVA